MSSPDKPGKDSFAAMFESDARSQPRRGALRRLSVGESVAATVVRVGRDAVFVELDGMREAFIESKELLDEHGHVSVQAGDTLRAVVVSNGDDGNSIRLGRTAPKGRGAEGLQAARAAGLPVEGSVTGVNKGGLEVLVDGVRAFCPARQVDTRFVGDLEPLIGQKLKFLVMTVKEGGREVVLSRRALVEQEAGDALQQLQETLVPAPPDATARPSKAPTGLQQGAIVGGKVSGVERFGVFVQIDGTQARGLIPAQELSRARGEDLRKRFSIGMPLTAKIVSVDPAGKIRLSIQAMKADEERASFEDYRQAEHARGAGLGVLGQKLQQAGVLGSKKKP